VQPIYYAAGSQSLVQGMENRLIQSRELITRKAAQVEIMRVRRIIKALFGCDAISTTNTNEKLLGLKAREVFEGALSANSAVQRLLNRKGNISDAISLISQGFLSVNCGVLHVTREDIFWMCNGGKGEIYTLQDLNNSQDMFIRGEISLEETLRVGGIPLNPVMNYNSSQVTLTKAKIGLWKMNEEKEEWAANVIQDLKSVREVSGRPLEYSELVPIFYKHREWVSDDTLIVSKCIEDMKDESRSTILLVSKDKRLARNITKTVGCDVILVFPEDLLGIVPEARDSPDLLTVENIKEAWKIREFSAGVPDPQRIYVDTGSLSQAQMRTEDNVNDYGINTGTVNRKTLIYSGISRMGRFSRVKLTTLKFNRDIRLYLLTVNGAERQFTPIFNWEEAKRSSVTYRVRGLASRFGRRAKGV